MSASRIHIPNNCRFVKTQNPKRGSKNCVWCVSILSAETLIVRNIWFFLDFTLCFYSWFPLSIFIWQLFWTILSDSYLPINGKKYEYLGFYYSWEKLVFSSDKKTGIFRLRKRRKRWDEWFDGTSKVVVRCRRQHPRSWWLRAPQI